MYDEAEYYRKQLDTAMDVLRSLSGKRDYELNEGERDAIREAGRTVRICEATLAQLEGDNEN